MDPTTIIKMKLIISLLSIIAGIIFIILSGLGIFDFDHATVYLTPAIKVINSSPGIVLIIAGFWILNSIKVKRTVDAEGNINDILVGAGEK